MFAKAIITFEPEHRRMLRANVAEYVRARPLHRIRKLMEEGAYDSAAYAQMGQLGWLGVIPSGEGELDACDLVALHRELGRKACPEPVIASGVLAAQLLAGSQNPAAAPALDELCSGETVTTLAWQSREGFCDASECTAIARRTDGGWIVDGSFRFVPHAGAAGIILVAARAQDGILIGLFQATDPAIAIRRGVGIDRGDFSDVALTGAFLPDSNLIWDTQDGETRLDDALDLARLAASAELVGAAEDVFAMTLDYLRQRKQFGKAIGANQTLQFMATDLFVQIELANSVLASAARSHSDKSNHSAMQIAACKSRCGDAAFLAARQAIQLHGAIGYTHECDVSLYVKRIMQLNAWLGNPATHRRRVARALPVLDAVA